MMLQFIGRRRSKNLRDFLFKALLVGLPITWFVIALEMTVLSVEKDPVLVGRRSQIHGEKSGESLDMEENPPVGEHLKQSQSQSKENYVVRKPKDSVLQEKRVKKFPREVQLKNGTWKNSRRLPKLDENVKLIKIEEDKVVVVAGDGDQAAVEIQDDFVPVRFDPPKQGEHGAAVTVDVNSLSAEEQARYHRGYNAHNFNEYASQLISLQRTVPDFRPEQCKMNDYSQGASLQPASIIMCFYNEAWTALLRSVHSVLDRSPPKLLREIILVDDFSDAEHLKSNLDNYMTDFPKVKIVRMPERVGLVRARLHGIEVAQGPVLIFLDSHIECADGWMEPLLSEVSKNSTVAVTPVIDIIDKDTMAVVQAVESIGVVDLRHMTFTWSRLTPRIRRQRLSPGHPFWSPTMAGGLFAINKNFFLELGTWDPGLLLWGGENLELSFKLWMCGGAIKIHPCSRVSHIFRDKSPYLKNDVQRIVKGNAARVAEVWLDDFKRFFFKGEIYNANLYGDTSERKQLRHVLACRSFRWYIDNVYPEIFLDGTGKHYGHITSVTGLCLTFKEATRQLMLSQDCANAVIWQTTNSKEIRHDHTCIEHYQGMLQSNVCDSQEEGQAFQVNAPDGVGSIVHISTGLCMTSSEAGAVDMVLLAPCLYGDTRQIWQFNRNPSALL